MTDLRNCLGNAFTFVYDERMMASAQSMVLAQLIGDNGDDNILTRLARVAHRSLTEPAAISNIRTALMGILEE